MKQVYVKYNNKIILADYWTLDELEDEPEFYNSRKYLCIGYNRTTNEKYDVYYDYEGECAIASPYIGG